MTLAIPLDPAPPATGPKPPPPHAGEASAPPTGGSTLHTAGWVSIAAGGALLAGAGVVLYLRHSTISDLQSSCPGGVCDVSRESALESERSRAVFEGPLAAGLALGGVVAAGVGVYLVTRPVRVTPMVSARGAGLGVSGAF
jgi:hypothetical protein